MALVALGFGFYGAYYAVGVAVGRVKRTQLNWVVTGIAAITNVVLCIVLIPPYGADGGGAASAIAYFLMAVLMVVRGKRVFPVGYEGGASGSRPSPRSSSCRRPAARRGPPVVARLAIASCSRSCWLPRAG